MPPVRARAVDDSPNRRRVASWNDFGASGGGVHVRHTRRQNLRVLTTQTHGTMHQEQSGQQNVQQPQVWQGGIASRGPGTYSFASASGGPGGTATLSTMESHGGHVTGQRMEKAAGAPDAVNYAWSGDSGGGGSGGVAPVDASVLPAGTGLYRQLPGGSEQLAATRTAPSRTADVRESGLLEEVAEEQPSGMLGDESRDVADDARRHLRDPADQPDVM
jgi:hypothetical protein